MIRSLAAITVLALTMAGCSPPKPVEKAPAASPTAGPAAPPIGYSPAKSPTLDAVRKRGVVL